MKRLEKCPLCEQLRENVHWILERRTGCKQCADKYFHTSIVPIAARDINDKG